MWGDLDLLCAHRVPIRVDFGSPGEGRWIAGLKRLPLRTVVRTLCLLGRGCSCSFVYCRLCLWVWVRSLTRWDFQQELMALRESVQGSSQLRRCLVSVLDR